MIPDTMKTVGEFLTECGARLAPFERIRVGKVGCGVSLSAIAVTVAALAMGLGPAGGSLASRFRLVVLAALATVILLFVIYAVIETLVERSVRSAVALYIRQSGTDMETLLKAAEMRSGSIAGGGRLTALLKETSAGR